MARREREQAWPRAPWMVTTHAVERYIQRHRPGWPFDAAAAELMREAATAVLHETPAGAEPIWRTRSGRLLVVRLDGVIATVLPMDSRKLVIRPDKRPEGPLRGRRWRKPR